MMNAHKALQLAEEKAGQTSDDRIEYPRLVRMFEPVTEAALIANSDDSPILSLTELMLLRVDD